MCDSLPLNGTIPNRTSSQQLIHSAKMGAIGRHCQEAIMSSRIRQIRIIHRQIIRLRLRRSCPQPQESPPSMDRQLSTMPCDPEPDIITHVRESDKTTENEVQQVTYQENSLGTMAAHTSASNASVAVLSHNASVDALNHDTIDSSFVPYQNDSDENLEAKFEPNQSQSPTTNLSVSNLSVLRSVSVSSTHLIAIIVLLLFLLIIYLTPILHKRFAGGETDSAIIPKSGGYWDSPCSGKDFCPTI